jgi:phosphatidylglycerophosphate synthase
LGLLVCVSLVLGYALDAADGQLARLRGGGSVTGEWLDHMVDSAKITSVHLAVLLTAFRHFGLPAVAMLVPLAFVLVSNVHFFGMILVDHLIRLHQGSGVAAPPSRTAGSPVLTVLKVPLDYGFLCLVFVLLGAPRVFFAVYAVLLAGWAAYLVLALLKWRGDLAGLERLPSTAAHEN